MNKVITINLNGRAYQLEEAGYELLHAYLQDVRNSLTENPDQEEILKDFEQAIAEKCDKYISMHKNVVGTAEVKTIIGEMGPVSSDTDHAHKEHKTDHVIKRLYRIREGAWIAGVCNGIAVYFGLDVKVVRLIFIFLALFTHGGAIGLYILLAFFIPAADTNEERAFARGKPFNAQEFMEEMKAKYGEYADEKYWRKYEKYWKKKDRQYYWKNVGHAWDTASHISTRIVAFVGKIALLGIAIIYSVSVWSIIIHGTIFNQVFFVGVSPALLIIFATAVAHIVSWPINLLVNEAYAHAYNTPRLKRPFKRISGFILWVIAIGFAATIISLSTPHGNKTYTPYGISFWANHHYICIGGNYYCDPAAANDSQDKAAAIETVRALGQNLQQVSLLAPAAVLKSDMQRLYGPYLTPELLAQWQNNPSSGLGRLTSNPHPDHIAIQDAVKNTDGSYTIRGNVIETTSRIEDGVAGMYPVSFTLVQRDNKWLISAIQK